MINYLCNPAIGPAVCVFFMRQKAHVDSKIQSCLSEELAWKNQLSSPQRDSAKRSLMGCCHRGDLAMVYRPHGGWQPWPPSRGACGPSSALQAQAWLLPRHPSSSSLCLAQPSTAQRPLCPWTKASLCGAPAGLLGLAGTDWPFQVSVMWAY